MAFVTSTTALPAQPAQPAQSNNLTGGDAALLLMGALAGATMTRSMRRQYRALNRKMVMKAIGLSFASLFNKKLRRDTVAGMPTWLFILLVIAAAAIGLWLFGLLGFLVLIALAIIIYLLLRRA